MNSSHRWSVWLLLACVVLAGCSERCYVPSEAAPTLEAKAAVVMDHGSRRVLMSKHADTRRPVASLVKLMTAILVERECDLGSDDRYADACALTDWLTPERNRK